jgi:hypothetical protein
MTAKLTSTGVTFGDGTTQTTTATANTGVASGTYGNSTNVPTLTINAQGRITSASNTGISIPNNCNNCSSYTSLTSKPSIPNNCANCAGDVNGGGANINYNCNNCNRTFEFNCSQCGQCQNCNEMNTGGSITKSGTTLRASIQLKRNYTNCNCNCNC